MTAEYNLVAVMGPTASGKTAFAALLAERINGEIISADSRQVYRHMNLGTGKDYADYSVNGKVVPVHLIDIADPGYKYSVFEYQRDFFKAFRSITEQGKFPVLCGGSGMYIEAATRNYRMEEVPRNDVLRHELENAGLDALKNILSSLKTLHNTTDIDTRERALRAIEIEKYYLIHPEIRDDIPLIRPLFIGIMYDRNAERQRITERLEKRLHDGMIEEVKQLLQSGIPPESLVYYGLEYRFITLFLQGRMDFETMKAGLNTAIHQFSKRQRTWFRKMERKGCNIHWIQGEVPDGIKLQKALQLLGGS